MFSYFRKNRGSEIDSPRQTGHLPGRFHRSRFRKAKPHLRKSAHSVAKACTFGG